MTSVNTNYRVGIISQPISSSSPTPAADSPDLMPLPEFGAADAVTLLAKLSVKNTEQQTQMDSAGAAALEKAEDAADARRIDAMKDKAQDTFMAGMASGLGQLGQAACSFGAAGSLSSAASATPSPSAQVAGPDASPEAVAQAQLATAQAKAAATTGEIASKAWGGAGDAAGGFGKIGEAFSKEGADQADIRATQAEDESKVAKRGSDALRKQQDAAAADAQKVIQILQDIKSAQAQEEHAAVAKM